MLFVGIFCFTSCCCGIYGVYKILTDKSIEIYLVDVGIPMKPSIIILILLLLYAFIATFLVIKGSLKMLFGKLINTE